MRGQARGGKEATSKLDRTWRHVVRALPSSECSAGQRFKDRLEDDRADAADVNERFIKFASALIQLV